MDHVISFESKGRNVAFFCSARSTRSGFAHDARLYVDGRQWSVGHCHYLNRTWESYRFQSACLTACNNYIDVRKEDLKDDYKHDNRIARVVGEKRKAELQAIWDSDPDLILFRDIRQTLNERCF